MQLIKIDFIIGSLKSGGGERVVSSLANHFADKGHIVRIITFRDGDAFELHEKIQRIRLHKQLFFLNFTVFRALIFLLKFYFPKKNRPQIINSHIDLMGIATIPVAKIYGLKIIVSEHFNHFNQKITLSHRILWNWFYKFPDALTVLTKLDVPFFKKKTKRVRVIYNPSSFIPIKNIDNVREKVILAVGDLNRYHHKGFDNLLRIALNVLPQYPDWKLKIVGQGDEGLTYLKGLLNDITMNEQIIFTGYRSNVKDLMANSEIFILSSRHEGLPLVLIEAMSQGMACISYNCISGPSDIISQNVNGILVEDQNEEAMITELTCLIKNSELRKTLRNNTSEGLNKFSIHTIGKKWEMLFSEILKTN